jgi:hypothetical protein
MIRAFAQHSSNSRFSTATHFNSANLNVTKTHFKHAMTQFLVFCNWGRAGLDGHTSDTLEK